MQESKFVVMERIEMKSQTWPMEVMALEGLVGVGKTTLSKKLESAGLAKVLRETVSLGILSLFYADPKRYGFAMQYAMLQKRNFQAELLRYESLVPGTERLAWDRSKLGDLLFAVLNHLLGSISLEEFEAYLQEFGCSSIQNLAKLDFVQRLTKVVFLFDDPERCRRRVLERGHDSEKNIPEAYYQALEDVHLALALLLLTTTDMQNLRVICLRWGEYDEAQQFLHAVASKPTTRCGLRSDSSIATDSHLDNLIVSSFGQIETSNLVDQLLSTVGSEQSVRIKTDFYQSQIRTVDQMRKGPWKSIVTDSDAQYSEFAGSFEFFSPAMRRFLVRALTECAGILLV